MAVTRAFDDRRMTVYAAKCYWPGLTRDSVDHAAAALRPAAGGPRYIGSLLFLEDELVLCLFDGGSPGSVVAAAEQAGFPCERVMRAAWLNEFPLPRSPQSSE